MKVSDLLKAIKDNPEDLTKLPQIIEQVSALENQDLDYQEKIGKLQNLNRQYLAQIPISDGTAPEQPEDKEPSMEDATQYIIDSLGGNK